MATAYWDTPYRWSEPPPTHMAAVAGELGRHQARVAPVALQICTGLQCGPRYLARVLHGYDPPAGLTISPVTGAGPT